MVHLDEKCNSVMRLLFFIHSEKQPIYSHSLLASVSVSVENKNAQNLLIHNTRKKDFQV